MKYQNETKPGEGFTIPEFDFVHQIRFFDKDLDQLFEDEEIDEGGKSMHRALSATLKDLNVGPETSYNLIMTTKYMLMVIREKAESNGIPINALGYAGSFFLKNKEDIMKIKKFGPLKILKDISKKWR
jgi:ATP adenylyltransferase/5',5'''-P-1,P-4-tetraphosphate phosphorylase II